MTSADKDGRAGGLLRLAAAGGALLAGLGAVSGRRAAAQQGAPLVGSWQVDMNPQGGSDSFQMLATFAADGTGDADLGTYRSRQTRATR